MAGNYTAPVQALIDELGRLPGIGPKSAQRMAYHLLEHNRDGGRQLAEALTLAMEQVGWLKKQCGDADGNEIVNITDAVALIQYIFNEGPAPEPLLAGDADVANSSRFIEDGELDAAHAAGIYPVPFRVADDCIIPIVNTSSP